jgi:hypothetical protein
MQQFTVSHYKFTHSSSTMVCRSLQEVTTNSHMHIMTGNEQPLHAEDDREKFCTGNYITGELRVTLLIFIYKSYCL